jgi:hypothetical protein
MQIQVVWHLFLTNNDDFIASVTSTKLNLFKACLMIAGKGAPNATNDM